MLEETCAFSYFGSVRLISDVIPHTIFANLLAELLMVYLLNSCDILVSRGGHEFEL